MWWSSAFISITLVPGRGARCTSAAAATGVRRGSTQTTAGGFGPARRSRTRLHNTVWVSAMLWPYSAMTSAWSMSVYEPGWPSQANDSLSEAAAVAVHSRVLPSMWLVPIPPWPMTASV